MTALQVACMAAVVLVVNPNLNHFAVPLSGTAIAHAENAPQPRTVHAIDRYPYLLWRETWGGGEMLANSWSLYTGSTVALTGDIEGEGWRMRSNGGYGQYTYRKWIRTPDGARAYAKFTGRKTFSDALIGYHAQWSAFTVKAFGGLASEQHFVDPRDSERPAKTSTYGGKVALEAWLTLSRRHWLAGDISFTSSLQSWKLGDPGQSVKTGLRAGYAVLDNLDLGLAARFESDNAYEAGRAGGFATLRIDDGGLTFSAGATADRDRRASHYVSVNAFLRY